MDLDGFPVRRHVNAFGTGLVPCVPQVVRWGRRDVAGNGAQSEKFAG